jgi:Domain of unknown function (DUF2760)
MGGVWTRLKLAFVAFFTILFQERLPAALEGTRPAAAAEAAPPPLAGDMSDRAIQMLALLQRDGRLIDFLMEDLTTYGDAQIGAAVRDVHTGCRGVLTRYVMLEPILSGKEGEPTSVPPDVDPAAVRLVGNVTGRPPFAGTLLHRGWRASTMELPALGAAAGRRIVAPAEVEVA